MDLWDNLKIFFNKPEPKIFFMALFSRIWIFCVMYLSYFIVEKGQYFKYAETFIGKLLLWDTKWYLEMAREGIKYIPGEYSNTGFSPFYPFLISVFRHVFFSDVIAGLIISNTSLIFAGIYLYKLVRMDFDKTVSFRTILYLMIFPVSFFFSIIYSESLFLFLSVYTYYHARKGNWKRVGIGGFLISLTRIIGVLIFIPFLIEYLQSKNFKFREIKLDISFIFTPVVSLITYMGYLYFIFGDAFIYFKTNAEWDRYLATPLSAFYNTTGLEPFYQIIFFSFAIFGAAMIIIMLAQRIRTSYLFYSVLLVCLYLSSNILEAIPRLMMVIFPFYISLAVLGKDKRIDYGIIIVFSSLLTLFSTLFINGYWFT